jgi:hypothetical protein
MGIKQPTEPQQVGAMVCSTFLLRVIHVLGPKKR